MEALIEELKRQLAQEAELREEHILMLRRAKEVQAGVFSQLQAKCKLKDVSDGYLICTDDSRLPESYEFPLYLGCLLKNCPLVMGEYTHAVSSRKS